MNKGKKVFLLIIKASIKAQLKNKKDFIFQMMIWFVFTFTPYVGLRILFQRFSLIEGDWSVWQISIIYAVLGISYDSARMFGRSLDSFHRYVKNGRFDALIIRPIPVFTQLLSQDFFIRRLAGIFQYGLVFIVSTMKLKGTVSLYVLIILSAFSAISCFFIFLGLLTIYASLCFLTKDRNLFTDMIVDTTASIGYLPINLLFKPIGVILTWFIPLYFVLYRQFDLFFHCNEYSQSLFYVNGLLSIVVCIIYFLLSKVLFRFFQRFYKSE